MVQKTENYIQLSVGKLFYVEYLPNDPQTLYNDIPIVCIHGNSTNNRIFEKLITNEAIGERFRFLAFDSFGHGKSDDIVDENMKSKIYCFDGIAKSIIEACDHLSIKKFYLIGYSKGGHEAMHILSLAPERVERIIVTGSPPLGNATDVSTGFKSSPAMNLCGHHLKFTEEEARIFIAANGFNTSSPEFEDFVQCALRTDGNARHFMLQAMLNGTNGNEYEAVSKSTSPVLILTGDNDHFINHLYILSLQFNNPLVKVFIGEGENHAYIWNNSAAFSRESLKFLIDT